MFHLYQNFLIRGILKRIGQHFFRKHPIKFIIFFKIEFKLIKVCAWLYIEMGLDITDFNAYIMLNLKLIMKLLLLFNLIGL